MTTEPAQEQTVRRGRPTSGAVDAALLQAYLDVVAEQGFAGASVEELSRRSGVAKTTIYRRWGTREALITHLHRSMIHVESLPDTGSLEGDLLALVDQVMSVMEDPRMRRVMQASLAEVLLYPELAAMFRERVLEERIAHVSTLFERARARGEVTAEIDARTFAYLLIGPNVFRSVVMGEEPSRALAERLVRILVGMVSAMRQATELAERRDALASKVRERRERLQAGEFEDEEEGEELGG